MSHQIVRLKSKFPYYDTNVPFERSVSQIKDLLVKFGCSRIGEMSDHRGGSPLHTLMFEKDGVPFIIEFPIIYTVSKQRGDKLNMNISGRIAYYKIKTLLIDVEIGILSFSQAMCPFLALPGKEGRSQPLYDYLEEHKAEITAGQPSLFPQLEQRTIQKAKP